MRPVTLPVVDTVAIPGALLLQVPPPVASVNNADEPIHRPEGAIIVPPDGNGLTVTVAVAEAAPQLPVTV